MPGTISSNIRRLHVINAALLLAGLAGSLAVYISGE